MVEEGFASATLLGCLAAAIDAGALAIHVIPACHRLHIGNVFMIFLAYQQFAAFKTDAFENGHDVLDMLYEEHGARQFNISKISGSIDMG